MSAMTLSDLWGLTLGTDTRARRMRITFAKYPPGNGPAHETVTEEGDVYYFKDGTWVLRSPSKSSYRSFRFFEVRGVEVIS
jgi:hypothetical protein